MPDKKGIFFNAERIRPSEEPQEFFMSVAFLDGCGGKSRRKSGDGAAENESHAALMDKGAESSFNVAVKTTARPVTAKVVFSRILLADGSIPNPNTVVVPYDQSPEED